MNQLLSSFGMQVLGTEDDFQTHPYSFSGLGDLIDRFQMLISGASGIPVTKLFGRSPAGMNSTGESDLSNYYDHIGKNQERDLQPALWKILPIMFMSEFGEVPEDLDFDFNPVREAQDSELADTASKITSCVTQLFTAGGISQKTLLKELKRQSDITGIFSSITDEDIEVASDKPENLSESMPPGFGQSIGAQDEFKESEHSRGGNPDNPGQFSSGSGASSSSAEQEKKDRAQSSNTSQISRESLKKSGKYGIINTKDGSLVPAKINPKVDTAYLKKHGITKSNKWNFSWTKELQNKNNIVLALETEDGKVQGLTSIRPEQGYMMLNLIEVAPHNISSRGEYKGVLQSLAAKSIALSIKHGFEGYCMLEAKTNLIGYYSKVLGAKQIGSSSRMIIEGRDAIKILKEWDNK